MTEHASKTCRECGATKALDGFYRHPQTSDGYLHQCKVCVRLAVRENREWKEPLIKAYDRARAKLPHRVEAQARYQKTARYRKAHARACRTYRAARR